ncbi:adenosylcobinamide-GDP ribazoletransferase [Nitratireductor kimnyeongensis]|uniref:Adenosylcobinamide-GDP ribazoletransferase n=1 Tax=Nitratireductor kimnyeongensis TaxID=430679 RepID=A0ABW0TEC5_9HYPH|nr:adenosylcobinamide-GDP ribazoletransferase [Nitratireductor kimnyeongensis]QZZ37600.1 adenosylcobinamide-GDP ribazoletransferase [Nitratireductor kimnyeongensis]
MAGFRYALRDIAACLGFYTRLPLPAFEMPAHGFANAQWAAPLAGLFIGAVCSAALTGVIVLGLPATIAAAIALAAGVLLTGGLHEDGLADVADGFGGGSTREKKLAIMKDSRIGSYGVAALILSFLLRWSALVALGLAAIPALLIAHTASRALMPALMRLSPPARENGLSAGAGQPTRGTVLVALAIGGVLLLVPGPGFALIGVPLLAAALFFIKWLAEKQIGGQTGDVLGTLQQLAETVLLLACVTHFI